MQQKPLRKYKIKNVPELKAFLDDLNNRIEAPDYIHSDPVQFMHAFDDKRDMEIAGFFAALMAWGRRDIICHKVEELLQRMEFRPAQFIKNYNPSMTGHFQGFKHRTFNETDMHGFMSALHEVYLAFTDFESFWVACYRRAKEEKRELMAVFHERFIQLSPEMEQRTHKHIPNPEKNSSCKRLNMYLRWCIRKNSPIDRGIWNFLPQADLRLPLDVHVARQARRVGLLTRKNSDWKGVLELTEILKSFDPADPVRYDYALFGLGVLNFTIPPHLILNG